MNVTICKICSMAANDKLCTSLGAAPICTECFMQKAEAPSDIHTARIENERQGRVIPRTVTENMTVWIGDGNYLPFREWFRQNSQLPCIVKTKPEPEIMDDETAELLAIIDKVVQANRRKTFDIDLPVKKDRKPGICARICSWFKAYFDDALDIKFHSSI